jgi:hypothetical protein
VEALSAEVEEDDGRRRIINMHNEFIRARIAVSWGPHVRLELSKHAVVRICRKEPLPVQKTIETYMLYQSTQ